MNPIEIEMMIELFETLEPPIQKAIADLIGKIHRKQLTAQDFLNQATILVNAQSA
jgi:hypothetical protein